MTLPADSMVSRRIAAIRADVVERGGSSPRGINPFVGDVAHWRAAQVADRSRVQHRAARLLELVRIAAIEIGPCWRLAGEHLLFRERWFTTTTRDFEQHRARLDEFDLTQQQKEEVRRLAMAWESAPGHGPLAAGRQLADIGQPDPAMLVGAGSWNGTDPTSVFIAWGWMENHSVRDFYKVLRIGFEGVADEIRAAMAATPVTDPDYPRKENFWRAALDVCEAGVLLGSRYAEEARRLATQANDEADRARLTEMARVCERVPARGARTFFEAVQSLWFAQVLTCGEDGINANSIGRLDQTLWPCYQADLAAGRLTRDEALELMEELACKLHRNYNVQNVVLGGVDAQGRSAVNELTYIVLEATRRIELIRPLCLRLDRNSPDELLDEAAGMIAAGGGVPFLFNDDCFIGALSERGIAHEDARDYAPIGCIELTIPGKANPHAVSGWFNGLKCVELALFDGRDPTSGRQIGPRTGMLTDHATFDSFYAAYQRQVEELAPRLVYLCNRGELAQRERGPLPCWSVLTDDCIARGRDITDGGAIYNYHSIAFVGTANAADSLMALKDLVFEKPRIDKAQLLDALKANFENCEPLRRTLLRGAPKYGNDCAEVDEMAARVAREFIALMDTMRSPLGGRYVVHLFSFHCNLSFGRTTGATPDGRKAGEPLAYSLSAHQGRDEKGLTALLRSISRLPHNQAGGATAAIVEIDPSSVEGDGGRRRLAQVIRAAIDMGVGQLQINVTTAQRLKQAQEDPEKYGNIPVRVAGYSQLFRLVPRDLQDHIIARTKHRS